jgi:hypothetical protein
VRVIIWLCIAQVTLSSLATIDEDQEAIQKLNLIIKGDTVS